MAAYPWQTATVNSVLYRLINTAADFLAIGDGHGPATELERAASMQYNYLVTADLNFGGAIFGPRFYYAATYLPGDGGKTPPSVTLSSQPYAGTFNGNFKRFYNGTIRKTTVSKTVSGITGSSAPASGLFDYGNAQSSFINCISELSYDGPGYVNVAGAIVGRLHGGTVQRCVNKGALSNAGDLGGMVGYLSGGASIKNCYNWGTVTAQAPGYRTAGMVGIADTGTLVYNCYNIGTITAATQGFGIASSSWNLNIFRYCYHLGPYGQGVQVTDGVMRGGMGWDTTVANLALVDGVGQWTFVNGQYPVLSGVSVVVPSSSPVTGQGLFFGAGF